MGAEIIRPVQFSADPQVAGPVHRMRLANANAANSFHHVREGLVAVAAASEADETRAAALAFLADRLSLQMRRLIDETGRFVQVLRAE